MFTFTLEFKIEKVITFVGEHTGKIDAKGRVPLPSQLFRQLGEVGDGADRRQCDHRSPDLQRRGPEG